MLKLQFDGDVLVLQPEGRITREDVATLTRTADEYLADHPKIAGVMVETRISARRGLGKAPRT